MTAQPSPGGRFRALLAEPRVVVVPGAYDAITARIIAHHGFGAGATPERRDVVFTEALATADEFGTFGSAGIGVPLLANMTEFGKTPYLGVEQFDALGFDVVIFPMLAFHMMLGAVDAAMAELASAGTQQGLLDRMMTRAELYELIDYPAWDEAERRYVTDL